MNHSKAKNQLIIIKNQLENELFDIFCIDFYFSFHLNLKNKKKIHFRINLRYEIDKRYAIAKIL